MKVKWGHIIIMACIWVINTAELLAQSGQEKNVASIRATGTVLNTVALEELTSELVQNPIFSPENPEQQIIVVDPVTGGGNAGFMIVRGSAGSTFNLQVPDKMILINSNDGSSFDISISLSYNTTQDQSSSELLREQMADFTLNESGEVYFWIGGTMDISSLTSGEYTGELIFELEYL